MADKPTYEELEQRINELENQAKTRKKVEEDLLREKDFSESVINSLPGIFYVFDEQRRFLRWNEHFEKMTEHSAEEFSKTSALEHIAEEDKEVAADAIQEVFVKGKSYVEANFASKSGKKTPYYFAGLRTRIENCTYLVGMGIDNTVRKKAEEALKGSMEYFQLHSNLANTLLKLPPSDFGNVIEDLLKRVVEFVGVDRGALIYWPEGDRSFREIYSWNREGIKPFRLPATPDKFFCLNKAIINGEIFSFSNVNELSSEAEAEKEYFLNAGIKSIIIIPMIVEGRILGVLFFTSFHTNKTWPDDLVQQLQLIGQTFAHSLKRKHSEEALRESEERFRSFMDSATEGFCLWDSDLNLIEANEAGIKLYSYDEKKENTEGKNILEIAPGLEKTGRYAQYLDVIKTGEPLFLHDVIPHPKFGDRYLNIKAFKVGEGLGMIAEDVTEHKRAEEALRDSSEKIKLFAYSVSHDIKNPIIGIYLLTKHLNENYKDILDEKGKNYCVQILKASEQLATLVDQINVFISTKEAPLIIERVNLNQVFDTVRDEFAAQILVRQISWSQPENLLEINVDRLSILRVMRNIVDNALKYGGDELSEINIGYEESDGFHILSIKDDGIGIAEKDSSKIFSPFERSVTAIGIEGTGLGLAIAHEIANQHKGKVWTEPGPEKGIIFYISISKDLKLTK
jgi:PAS domain S-box-containing protein